VIICSNWFFNADASMHFFVLVVLFSIKSFQFLMLILMQMLMFVGNPYTDVNSGTPAMLETFWGHQLVAKPTWDEYSAKCTSGKVPHPKDCVALTAELNEQVGDLNPYGK
jgi:hypothetical protein